MKNSKPPINIVLFAFEGISAFHLSVPCLVFQDIFVGQNAPFTLTLCSEMNCSFATGSGFSIQINKGLEVIKEADILIIPSWPNHLPDPSAELITAVQQHHAQGKLLIGLCLGSYVLAYAGVLDGKQATTHWLFAAQFQQQFPAVDFNPNPLFIEQETVITSAGIAASLDCCLHILRSFCGSELANALARKMVTAPFRSGGQQQYIPVPVTKKSPTKTSLSHVINQVEQNLNQPHSIESIAKRCAMSKRNFTRQFKANYGCTFGEWLKNQRLILSQQLLETTQSSVNEISELAGFGSESVFRKHFKSAFHVSPTQWRASFKE